MLTFAYRAVSRTGDVLRGEMEAPSRDAALARLHAEGAVPLQVTGPRQGWWTLLSADLAVRRMRPRAVADFVARLATLIGAGVPLDSAVGILASSKAARRTLGGVLSRLRNGASLADAMEADGRDFPPLVISMVRAGELSGTLAATLARLGEYLRRSEDSAQTIRSALIYPAILLAAASASVLVVFTAVLPALRPVIEASNSALPLPVSLAFALSDAVQAVWWLLPIAAIAIALLGRRAWKSPAQRARLDALLLRLPLLRTAILRAEGARFARTLGTLIGGGVPLPSALEAAQRVVANRVLGAALAHVTRTVREGGGLADPLAATNLFPDMAVQIVRIGEATGQVDRMLLQLAEIMEQDFARDTGRALAVLVPALTIGLGLLVAGIVASVMMAVLSINDLAR
jgi:general secretion pathway protein F